MTTTYLALGPHCFGKGATPAEAERNAARNWPRNYAGVKRPSARHFSLYASDGQFSVCSVTGAVSTTGSLEKLRTSILAD